MLLCKYVLFLFCLGFFYKKKKWGKCCLMSIVVQVIAKVLLLNLPTS